MKVNIRTITENPAIVVSMAAGTSYGKENYDFKRIEHCFKNNHMSVFEHVYITFEISGISRSCSHQLVRHRMASFVEKSLRYVKIDTKNDDWYVTPESIKSNEEFLEKFKNSMSVAASEYNNAIENFGMNPEDARYILPLSTKTEITVTMNLREFLHFLELRTSKNAQYEIRYLAKNMLYKAMEFISEVGSDDDCKMFKIIFKDYIDEGDTMFRYIECAVCGAELDEETTYNHIYFIKTPSDEDISTIGSFDLCKECLKKLSEEGKFE